MDVRTELVGASDAVIADAIQYADPMVLRGLLYQLTGNERIAATKVTVKSGPVLSTAELARAADLDFVRAEAIAFLKSHRDQGAPNIPPGPPHRIDRSIELALGADIPACDRELWREQLALDPWARGLSAPLPSKQVDFSVAVIGAGMGGLNAGVHLKHVGIPFMMFEKNSEVGGTWFENRYPGARVDTPSRAYTHIFGADFEQPYAFCPRKDNLAYFKWVADKFGLRNSIQFDTEVTTVIWDEGAKLWEITANGPNGRISQRVNAVIASVGFLSRPNLPTIAGMQEFKGPAFHTARWPADLDLTGKRVAVIGTGATGYQTVPEIAKRAAHTYVFQRTPNWCSDVADYLAPFPPQATWLDRNFPYFTNFTRLSLSWIYGPEALPRALHIDPNFKDPHARSAHNKQLREHMLAFIQWKLESRPELMEKMIPEAPPLSARLIVVDSQECIYDALLRDNVTLVSDPIEQIKPRGIRAAGNEYPVDIIVYATGFKANDFLWPMEVRGRDGVRIEELWGNDGARAYIGTLLPGFPNFFMLYGPNTNNMGGLGIVDLEEMMTRFALECFKGLITEEKQSVDVTTDAYWRYNAELDSQEAQMIYMDPRASNYYRNTHGRSAVNLPIDIRRMWRWLRHPTMPSSDTDGGIRPYFGEDLIVR